VSSPSSPTARSKARRRSVRQGLVALPGTARARLAGAAAPAVRLRMRGVEFAWDATRPRALIMGIVNVTPDSFADGGRYLDAGRGRQPGADARRRGGRPPRRGCGVDAPGIAGGCRPTRSARASCRCSSACSTTLRARCRWTRRSRGGRGRARSRRPHDQRHHGARRRGPRWRGSAPSTEPVSR
jgi:hypothetical protein